MLHSGGTDVVSSTVLRIVYPAKLEVACRAVAARIGNWSVCRDALERSQSTHTHARGQRRNMQTAGETAGLQQQQQAGRRNARQRTPSADSDAAHDQEP
jgi:hypothetical protein